jgi:hypothetical protein
MKEFLNENWFKLMVGSALVLFSISSLIFSINYSVGVPRDISISEPWKMKFEEFNKNSKLGDTVSYKGLFYRVIPSEKKIGKKTIDLNRPLKLYIRVPKYEEYSEKSKIGDTVSFKGKLYILESKPQ